MTLRKSLELATLAAMLLACNAKAAPGRPPLFELQHRACITGSYCAKLAKQGQAVAAFQQVLDEGKALVKECTALGYPDAECGPLWDHYLRCSNPMLND
ncbi:hypothetical protein QTI66_30280 [Variovorax sp. J22R133]|uniref:hypothetical protein n=1 Tax=Variovorax brevis TaxID=3053503 RepID=UPI0025782A24|nr:hypothetical protein [Variovorax sp. J22R133]MDM0116437.1 hypothetical protein [Variovorax sp. J22R133]